MNTTPRVLLPRILALLLPQIACEMEAPAGASERAPQRMVRGFVAGGEDRYPCPAGYAPKLSGAGGCACVSSADDASIYALAYVGLRKRPSTGG